MSPLKAKWLPAVIGVVAVAMGQFGIGNATVALADPMVISGTSFLGNHPTLGNEGIDTIAPEGALTDDAALGVATVVDLRIDLTTYATTADPVVVEDATLMFPGGDILFSFGPGTVMPDPPNGVSSGTIVAEILTASTTIPSSSVDDFIGGSFAFTYNSAEITAGTGSTGGTVQFQQPASASFTFTAVPEPAAVVLALIGAIGAALIIWRQRQQADS